LAEALLCPAVFVAQWPGMTDKPLYESQTLFDTSRIGAAALYCSDGRYGNQMDEYLHEGCGWPRYDRLAIPGGPATLSGDLGVLWEESSLRKYLEFLVRGHNLKHLALIAHENCSFYRDWLHVPLDKIGQRQLQDLHQARQRLHIFLPHLQVYTLIARKQEGKVRFFATP
jgi:hypothetical protein